jgi:hypothetical protein
MELKWQIGQGKRKNFSGGARHFCFPIPVDIETQMN